MKYKNLLIIITISLFLIVCGVSSIYLFKISDVNVKVTSTDGNKQVILDDINSVFQNYNNKSLIFLSKKKVTDEIVEANPYIKVNSIDKKIPNIINVDVEERFECFCLKYNNKFYYLDSDLFIVNVLDINKNNLNNFSNPIIEMSSDNFSDSSLKVGNTLNIFDETTKSALNYLGENIIKNLQYYKGFSLIVKDSGFYRYSICIEFVEGVKYNISSYNVRLNEKLDKVYNDYINRVDKSIGNYYVDINVDGEILIK